MFELVLISIALIGTGFAGYWDLKTTNVPDLLIIGMIIVAIILHATQGFMIGDFTNLINAFRYGGLFLLFGLIMYFTGQWGGGDGETLVAIGFLIPTATFVKTCLLV
jgi:Flp pilus assembly protein protease CpaA